jgi:hypothetical protein
MRRQKSKPKQRPGTAKARTKVSSSSSPHKHAVAYEPISTPPLSEPFDVEKYLAKYERKFLEAENRTRAFDGPVTGQHGNPFGNFGENRAPPAFEASENVASHFPHEYMS